MWRKARRHSGELLMAVLLALAALPAAADQRVHVWDNDIVFEEDTAAWGLFQCSGPVYHGILNGHEDLWLWFEKGDPLFWSHGQYVFEGSDYFSTQPSMGGNVISGPFKYIAHLSRHEAGPPETWQEVVSGNFWNVHAPRFGSILHQTLGLHQSTMVTPEGLVYTVMKEAVGRDLFDFEELCESLGYELLP